MVNKQKKLIAFSLLTAVTAFGVTLVALNGVDVGAFSSKAAGVDYELTLNGSNGNVADDAFSLKTKEAQFATAAGNTWKVNYKNAKAANGKVAVIGAKGYYALGEPVYGLGEVVFNSNAQAGDAIVKYGKTSWCLDGEADLATGTINMNGANYFKIVAKNEVTINSVGMNYSCEGETGLENVSIKVNGDHYEVGRPSPYAAVTKMVIPDYYWTQADKSDYKPVTTVIDVSGCGIGESVYNLAEFYLPETVEIWSGNWGFYSSNKIKEYTLGYKLRTANGSRYIPKGELEVLNIHSKRLAASSTCISKSDMPKLKTVNVSYDVESLPTIVSSWPEGVTINYEGTEAEWAALSNGLAIWNSAVTVMCSDTTVSNVKLHFANATLAGYSDGDEISVVTGKELADPGKPVYEENAKKFDGWYDAAEGGNKVVFPVEVNENMDLYARFIDWPAGTSIDNPKDVSAGGTFNLYSDADVPYMYVKYTAAKDEVVKFQVNNEAPASCTPYAKYYDGNKQLLTLDFNNNAATDSTVKVARYWNTAGNWKIRFEQGETYYVAVGLGPNGGQEGTFDLIVTPCSAAAADDYTVAKDYTVGQTEEFEMNKTWYKWHKFTVQETGDFWFECGDGSTVWTSSKICYFDNGVWKEVQNINASINSKAAAVVHLEQGKQYYVASSANGAGNGVFKILNTVPAGTSMGNAVTAEVGGAAVALNYQGITKGYAKFVVAEAGTYILNATNAAGSGTIELYNAAEAVAANKVTLATGTVSADKIAELEAGTYYAVVSTLSASTNYEFKVAKAPAGYNAKLAIEVTMTLETESISLDHKNVNGTYFKFTAPATKYIVFTGTDITQTIKINGNEMKDGEMHAKFTAGTTYNIVVTGDLEDDIILNVEFLDSIKDGTSKETAFDYVLGTHINITSSTRVHYAFTTVEAGDYLMTTDYSSYYALSSYFSYFNLYKGDSKVTGGDYTKTTITYTLEAETTYRIEAYSYGFKLELLAPGLMRNNAIEKTIGAEDTSVVLENKFADGTWYKVAAPAAGFIGFAANDEATLTIYLGTNTTAEGIANANAVEFAIAANDVLYLFVEGDVGNHTFTVSHPAAVKNGKTFETAFDYVADAGQEYMSIATINGGSSVYLFYRIEGLTAGTQYCFSSNAGKDIDITEIYDSSNKALSGTTKKIDAGSGFAAYRCGANGDFYSLFTAPADGVVVMKVRWYASGTYAAKLNLFEWVA